MFEGNQKRPSIPYAGRPCWRRPAPTKAAPSPAKKRSSFNLEGLPAAPEHQETIEEQAEQRLPPVHGVWQRHE